MNRITERLEEGKWVYTEFKNLAVGDIFRLWEPEEKVTLGEPLALQRVQDTEGFNVWKCTSDPEPYTNENSVDTLKVDCESFAKESEDLDYCTICGFEFCICEPGYD